MQDFSFTISFNIARIVREPRRIVILGVFITVASVCRQKALDFKIPIHLLKEYVTNAS